MLAIPRPSFAAALVALLAGPPAPAQSLLPGETPSSIAVTPVGPPRPVPGADGRVHLAYELLVTNLSTAFVTLDRVEALGPGDAALGSLEGDALAAMTRMWSGEGRRLEPGGSAIVFMDVTLPGDALAPERLAARIAITRELRGEDGAPAPWAGQPLPATATFTGAETAPQATPPVVVDAPLRGEGWVAFNGCCAGITSHRGAAWVVNGDLTMPERFAIDWVRLDAEGRLFTGDGTRLEDYAFYGAPVLSVAPGRVVNLYDRAEDQTPMGEVVGVTAEDLGGNTVVVDIGGGNFAFYAHLRPGSLQVEVGDEVVVGQELGRLGNTGNSTAPHLHFHVMDAPSPLHAQGVPYVFRSFVTQGTLAPGSDDAILAGAPAEIVGESAGAQAAALPLDNAVVDFD